jgi:hypothetical protein
MLGTVFIYCTGTGDSYQDFFWILARKWLPTGTLLEPKKEKNLKWKILHFEQKMVLTGKPQIKNDLRDEAPVLQKEMHSALANAHNFSLFFTYFLGTIWL